MIISYLALIILLINKISIFSFISSLMPIRSYLLNLIIIVRYKDSISISFNVYLVYSKVYIKSYI